MCSQANFLEKFKSSDNHVRSLVYRKETIKMEIFCKYGNHVNTVYDPLEK